MMMMMMSVADIGVHRGLLGKQRKGEGKKKGKLFHLKSCISTTRQSARMRMFQYGCRPRVLLPAGTVTIRSLPTGSTSFSCTPMKYTALLFLSAISLSAAEPRIVAHRGASHDAPENTLPAFELAWQRGADAIEGDFHLTSDGRIICIHDFDTKRVAGTGLVVKDTSFDELRKLDAGAWFSPRFAGTRLPEFSEVAATVPENGKFYIEVKCGPEIVPALITEIEKSGLKDGQVMIISFKAPVIREFKRRAPRFKAFWLSSFDQHSPLDPSAREVIETLRSIRADGFSSKADGRIDDAYLKTIRQAGFEYHCWTVDDPNVAKRFRELGTLSITTNRPGWLRAQLTDR